MSKKTELREIGVGLLGLGNVGAGVVRLLADNAAAIEARLGARLVVRKIAVRELAKERGVLVDKELLTTDPSEVIDREDVEIVCELVGGETSAKDYVLRAIQNGKHVVTANKALLAHSAETLFSAAETNGVDVYYEASVCGGVPIIRALREGLASDRVEELFGIVNGTSNFILSEMTASGAAFADVLAEAQAAGYAEADPRLDVSGVDAAHKLAILAMLCFGTMVRPEDIVVEGIESLEAIDFEMAKRFGYVIKPLVIGRAHGTGESPTELELRVHPTMIPASWLLADVPGAQNAVYVRSYALGPSMYYGAGAGMMPTAMAVVSDLIEVCRNIASNSTGALPLRSYQKMSSLRVRDRADIESQTYLRFEVLDRPGVLGQVTTLLGEHGVSIRQVIQERPDPEGPVAIVVLTHSAREGDLRAALEKAATLEAVTSKAQLIRIA